MPELKDNIKEMQSLCVKWRMQGKKISFVPTMGALHDGHVSLLKEGRSLADKLALSIFVNPAQFAPNEDFAKYPRDIEGDMAKARECKVDAVFFPSNDEMYPEGFQTYVEVADVTKRLCGQSRPAHFKGVATVVQKLFNIVQPNVAIFGEKDFQQLVAIKRMVKDLNMPVEVIGMPIVREADGLAMSSRNAYLSPAERKAALFILHSLDIAKKMADCGERSAGKIIKKICELLIEQDLLKVDYCEICNPNTLKPESYVKNDSRLLMAVFAGKTRLIDNCALLC